MDPVPTSPGPPFLHGLLIRWRWVIILAASLFLTSLVVAAVAAAAAAAAVASFFPPPPLAHHNLFSGPGTARAAANHLTQSGALSAFV